MRKVLHYSDMDRLSPSGEVLRSGGDTDPRFEIVPL